jgi:hypothetical protein
MVQQPLPFTRPAPDITIKTRWVPCLISWPNLQMFHLQHLWQQWQLFPPMLKCNSRIETTLICPRCLKRSILSVYMRLRNPVHSTIHQESLAHSHQ